jgi:hypothetical protein
MALQDLYPEEEGSEHKPELPLIFDFNTTPKKVSDLQQFGEELYKMVEGRSSPLHDAVYTYTKGAMARVYSGEQAEIDVTLI